MSKKVINTSKSPKAIGPYSQAVLKSDTLYLSGQIPLHPDSMELVSGGIKEQTKQVLNNIQEVLKEAGMDFSNLLKVSIFVKDLNHFAELNEVYKSYFSGENFPARETIEVSRLPLDVLVEISAIASK